MEPSNRSNSLRLVLLLILILGSVHTSAQNALGRMKRKPGDLLVSRCASIPLGTVSPNVCANITEGDECGAILSLSINGAVVISEALDLKISSRGCSSQYKVGPLTCDICTQLNMSSTDPEQQCLMSEFNCQFLPPVRKTLGCFNSSALAPLERCRSQCPNHCSDHGSCQKSVGEDTWKCACEDKWYGDDCSSDQKIFKKCFRVDQLSADTCGSLEFTQDCQAIAQVTVGGSSIMEQSWSLSRFESLFQSEGWCEGAFGCESCIEWTGRTLNATNFSGCASAHFSCAGQDIKRFLGCYQENDVIPRCFGGCTNYCNFHGICKTTNDGGKECVCDEGWTGNACQTQFDGVCPEGGCNSHGVCNAGQCICDDGFSGSDCSSKGKKRGANSVEISIIVILVVIILLGAGAGAVFYWKKRSSSHHHPYFSAQDLEIQDDENDESAIEIDNV